MNLGTREAFFLQLLADYILLNDIAAQPLTEKCLHKVGIKYSWRVEDAYRALHHLEGKLNPEQFGDMIVSFLNGLNGKYTINSSDTEKIIFNCYACPFEHLALKTPALCQIMAGISGGAAARNFPYCKVSIESSLAQQSSFCRIVIYLQECDLAVNAFGTIFQNDPSAYLLTRDEIKVYGEKIIAENFVYKKYIENLEHLQSNYREMESEYNELRDEIFTDLKLGVVTVNEQGKITYINKIAQDLLGVIDNLDSPEDTSSFQALLQETLATGTRFNQHVLVLPITTGTYYYSFNTAPLYDENDNIAGAVAVFQDITEKKLIEQEILQMEKYSLVAELAAGTAHEIRNPMTTLRGFLQILSKEFKSETKGSEYCSLMINEIDRANTIIKEFLLLTKPTAPKLKEADLHVILEEIFLLIESKSLLENVDLRRVYTRSLPLVRVDVSQIKQVFLNLATNSIQAMPDGGELTISTYTEKNKAFVKFSDTGCGIDQAVAHRIMDPFFTTKESGTGLGLTISYRILESHGGKLSFHSIPGKGTSFTVELPAIEKDE
jgi:two-component system sensor histidine kinase AtoS